MTPADAAMLAVLYYALKLIWCICAVVLDIMKTIVQIIITAIVEVYHDEF